MGNEYNPALDEASLSRCLRRLHEVAHELGEVGDYLDRAGRTHAVTDTPGTLARALESVRVPGFCGYKLTAEAWILYELVAVRVASLRRAVTDTSRLEELDAVESSMNELEPLLRSSLTSMRRFSSLDGVEQVRSMVKELRAGLTEGAEAKPNAAADVGPYRGALELLAAADDWATRPKGAPDASVPADRTLDVLAKPGRSAEKSMALGAMGFRTEAAFKWFLEVVRLGVDDKQYARLVDSFANVLRRNLSVASDTGPCSVCGQLVANPSLARVPRWLLQGLINVGRAIVFTAVVAVVATVVIRLVSWMIT